jgi:hypothetical protein
MKIRQFLSKVSARLLSAALVLQMIPAAANRSMAQQLPQNTKFITLRSVDSKGCKFGDEGYAYLPYSWVKQWSKGMIAMPGITN